MLSYKTPARIQAENAKAAEIMAQHAAKPYSHVKQGPAAAADKAAKGAALLEARKRG